MLDRRCKLRSRSTRAVLPIGALMFLALLGAQTTQRSQLETPTWPYWFIDDFKIAHYLQTAVDIQKLEPAQREKLLRDLVKNPQRSSEVFPLCRMLFQAKPNGEFRRTGLGAPYFIDGGEIKDWPLEPITLRDGVPILVVKGYILNGAAETPDMYLEYCLKHCDWNKTVYTVKSKEQIRKTVEEFIASNPNLRIVKSGSSRRPIEHQDVTKACSQSA